MICVINVYIYCLLRYHIVWYASSHDIYSFQHIWFCFANSITSLTFFLRMKRDTKNARTRYSSGIHIYYYDFIIALKVHFRHFIFYIMVLPKKIDSCYWGPIYSIVITLNTSCTSFHSQINSYMKNVFPQELELNNRFWIIHNYLESIKEE